MLKTRRVLMVIALVLFSSFLFAQQKWPNTLLWRISGKGLTKPSYLYGTMHLQDKRIFQFPDSLYNALEKVDGFALEIDIHEMIDSVFIRSIEEAQNDFYKKDDEKVSVDKKKIDKSSDSLLKSLGLKSDRITRKDLKRIRDLRMQRFVSKGEMPTIVDGYLFGMALRLGKWMGGIEDVTDQLDLKDELGADLNPDEVFLPEADLRHALDDMIQVYINKDLQGIADYVDSKYTSQYKDLLLTHRNIKMARRMDSLSALRTMFFAVGAAHLPGDSGVISLLRARGFTVEPVFSAQSISPETYSSKLNSIPWFIIDGELFSIEMPGKATDYDMFGEAFKIKMFFDLPTMAFYMAGRTVGKVSSEKDMERAFQNMAYRMTGNKNKVKTKQVTIGTITATQGIISNSQAAYKVVLVPYKNSMYLLMAGSGKRSALDNSDLDRFFSSFRVKESVVDDKKWNEFSIPGKAFTLQLPGTPKPNKSVDRQSNGSNWNFYTYDLVDNDKGLYYLFQVRELMPGYYLEGDSTYFSVYKEDLSRSFETSNEKQFKYKDYPAFQLDFSEKKENVLYKVFGVIRGNRVYTLMAGGNKDADFSDVDKVFNSLTFESYASSEWKKYKGEGFYTTSPAPIKRMMIDTSTEANLEHFVAYDANGIISYEVFRNAMPPMYWVESDSLFYKNKMGYYEDFQDTVLQTRRTLNGGLKGMEALIQKRGSNTVKKVRMMVNKDSLYTIITFIPVTEVNRDDVQKFFDDFRVDNEIQPTIYTSRSAELFRALQSQDSVVFERALELFTQVRFTKADLPVLQEALLHSYLKTESSAYYTVNRRIVNQMNDLADEGTVRFISDNYQKLSEEKEELKYDLLRVLAGLKTQSSYALLKNLLVNHTPLKGDPSGMSYSITDSMQLGRTLFPEILQLSNDSLFREVLVSTADKFVDSNFLSMNDLLPYRNQFVAQAKINFKKIKEDEDFWWNYYDWVPFIGKFNDHETNNLLRDLLGVKSASIRYQTVVALLKNDQSLNGSQIEGVAASNNYRKDLYEEMKKMNKLKLFPPRYATQLRIAESEIFQMASDEDEPSSVSFIEDRTAEYMGKKKKFFLFKVTFGEGAERYSYLGITGPYDLDSKEVITSSEASGIHWEEEYDKGKVDLHFKAVLEQMEKWTREQQTAK